MGTDQQAHRAGALKQKNKTHKTGRHRSKGTIDNDLKGKHRKFCKQCALHVTDELFLSFKKIRIKKSNFSIIIIIRQSFD